MSFIKERFEVDGTVFYPGCPLGAVRRAERRARVATSARYSNARLDQMVAQILGRLSTGLTMSLDELEEYGVRGPVAEEAIDYLVGEGLVEVVAVYGETKLVRLTEAGRAAHRGLMIEQRVAARQREAA